MLPDDYFLQFWFLELQQFLKMVKFCLLNKILIKYNKKTGTNQNIWNKKKNNPLATLIKEAEKNNSKSNPIMGQKIFKGCITKYCWNYGTNS